MQDAPHRRVLALPAKVRLDKQSTLIAQVSLTKKKTLRTIFTTLHFLCNLRMGLKSLNVILHKAEKACKGQIC
jgi:hypothetical protein